VTGLIVDAGRPEDVRAAIVRLFDEPETCEMFGRAGAARFRAEFTDVMFRARFAAAQVVVETGLTRAATR
jgi:hypothetical protein